MKKVLKNKGKNLKLTTLGFTLIELLAVIVILAILALIVSPVISGVISDAKKASAQRSIEGYVKAIELAEVQYQYTNGGLITQSIENLTVSSNANDRITINSININKKGIVETASFTIDDYTCNYINNEVECMIL